MLYLFVTSFRSRNCSLLRSQHDLLYGRWRGERGSGRQTFFRAVKEWEIVDGNSKKDHAWGSAVCLGRAFLAALHFLRDAGQRAGCAEHLLLPRLGRGSERADQLDAVHQIDYSDRQRAGVYA